MSAHVVVTGAAGFLGGHVVETLLARGQCVLGIDREPTPPHLEGRAGLGWLQEDLTAPAQGADAVGHGLGGAAAVWHLAGCPGVRDAGHDVEHRRQRDNVDATTVVLDRTPRHTPVLVTSSSSVYGGSTWSRPSVETDVMAPRGGYAVSKVRTERLCAARQADGGSVLVARPFTLAGERQRADMALAGWIDAARAGRPLRILGAPSRTRDVTDVRQAADLLIRLVETGAGGVVNVGTGAGHTLKALADAVRTVTGRDVPVAVEPAWVAEVRHTRADTRRLRSLVGAAPHTDLIALVARQAAAPPELQPHPRLSVETTQVPA